MNKLAYALGMWIFSSLAWGQTSLSQPHIYVQGSGEVSAVPELARITLSVSLTDTSSTSAKQQVDEQVAGLLQALEQFAMAEDEVKASDLRLSPEYRFVEKGHREQSGFRATRQVRLTLEDLAQLSQLLEVALEQGFTDIQQIELDVKDRRGYQEQARALAIADARQKATSLAKGFGVNLGLIYRIEYPLSPRSMPVMVQRAPMMMDNADNSYTHPSLNFSDQVTAVFLMQP